MQGINVRVVAVIILTLVMMVNIIVVKNASIVQQVLVVCLMIALAVFTAFGIFRVDFTAYVQPQGFLTDGPLGFCSAAAILTFACGGTQNIINFSAEAKDQMCIRDRAGAGRHEPGSYRVPACLRNRMFGGGYVFTCVRAVFYTG